MNSNNKDPKKDRAAILAKALERPSRQNVAGIIAQGFVAPAMPASAKPVRSEQDERLLRDKVKIHVKDCAALAVLKLPYGIRQFAHAKKIARMENIDESQLTALQEEALEVFDRANETSVPAETLNLHNKRAGWEVVKDILATLEPNVEKYDFKNNDPTQCVSKGEAQDMWENLGKRDALLLSYIPIEEQAADFKRDIDRFFIPFARAIKKTPALFDVMEKRILRQDEVTAADNTFINANRKIIEEWDGLLMRYGGEVLVSPANRLLREINTANTEFLMGFYPKADVQASEIPKRYTTAVQHYKKAEMHLNAVMDIMHSEQSGGYVSIDEDRLQKLEKFVKNLKVMADTVQIHYDSKLHSNLLEAFKKVCATGSSEEKALCYEMDSTLPNEPKADVIYIAITEFEEAIANLRKLARKKAEVKEAKKLELEALEKERPLDEKEMGALTDAREPGNLISVIEPELFRTLHCAARICEFFDMLGRSIEQVRKEIELSNIDPRTPEELKDAPPPAPGGKPLTKASPAMRKFLDACVAICSDIIVGNPESASSPLRVRKEIIEISQALVQDIDPLDIASLNFKRLKTAIAEVRKYAEGQLRTPAATAAAAGAQL